MRKVPLLANDFAVFYESSNPKNIYCATPGLARLDNGRLVATMDLIGPGVKNLSGGTQIKRSNESPWVIGKVFTSDDSGKTWTHRTDFPFFHARPFVVGNSLYVIGQGGDIMIIRSDDQGKTWSGPVKLTQGQDWSTAACNVHYANGNVYLAMERRVYFDIQSDWPIGDRAPVLMRAPMEKDLTRHKSWTFASELVFRDLVDGSDVIGIPFWSTGHAGMSPMGWLETNVVQFVDPNHIWCDPTGHTFHLWMRAHTGCTGYAGILKVTEKEDGSMITSRETVPSGRHIVYVPCPGGQMRFHISYDEKTKLYWLLSSLTWDSMTRPERLPEGRVGLPDNERHVLALYFSKNMTDWHIAGVVAQGKTPKEARHYASMVFQGEDLLVLSRSADQRAKNAHDGNLITFHTVKGFRDLVY
jgi:hypothetical protein